MNNVQKARQLVSLYTGKIIEDKRPVETYDNTIRFFMTPEFKYKGVIVKCAIEYSEIARNLLQREAEFLENLQKLGFNQTTYKIPELIAYYPQEHSLIEQRGFEKTGLQLLTENSKNVEKVAKESANWYANLHNVNADEEFDIKIKDTPTFKELLANLIEDKSTMQSFPEYNKMKRLAKNQKTTEFDSVKTNLHGNPHLSHLYFEHDGVYGIDFNLSGVGYIHRELGNFISNTYYHITSKTGDEKLAERFIKDFVTQYEKNTGMFIGDELNFFIAKSFYDKARYANVYKRGKENDEEIRSQFLKEAVEKISDSNKMKLLYITWGATGGVDRIVDYLNSYSSRMGISTNTLAHKEGEGFKFNDLEFPEKDGLIQYFKENKIDFDIVHVNTPTIADKLNGGFSEILNESNNPKVIYSCHGLMPRVFNATKLRPLEEMKENSYSKAEYEIMEAAESITFPTNFQKRLAVQLYPEFASKYVTIPNGSDFYRYDTDKINEEAQKIRFNLKASNDKRKNILYVGRIALDKGVVDLAEACRNLSEEHDINLVYVGPYENEIMKNIARAMPESKFIGKVNEREKLAAWYKAADVVVAPSYHESFCMVGLEALMLGIPFLTSSIDGPKEIFVDKGWAIGVREPGDVRGIELGIEDVLFDPYEKERASIAKVGVKKMFDIRRIARDYINLYESLSPLDRNY